MTAPHGRRAAPVALLALALCSVIIPAACTGATGPGSPAPDGSTPTAPTMTAPGSFDPGSGTGGGATGDPGSSGAVGGDPGTGGGILPPGNPLPIDPGAGQARLVIPLPGRANPRPVTPIALQVSIDGRHVLVKVSWYGGLEPCSVLDSVAVVRNGTDIGLTPIEGASEVTVACPDIAVLKATIVDLGELEPGTWHISSPGSDVRPLEVVID